MHKSVEHQLGQISRPIYFFPQSVDASRKKPYAVTYIEAGGVSQELCEVCLSNYERYLQKQTLKNYMTMHRLFSFVWSIWRPLVCMLRMHGHLVVRHRVQRKTCLN